METTPELIIFLVVGAVAIIAAVMMLISENAVHSALFLVLNFACVGFLFLMLNAAFLAMVQVAVYAGAIMVLFLFVIMLLGAERLVPEEEPRFPWLTPVAVVLTTVFLLTAGIGILEADISTTEPEPLPPMVRVINVIPDAESLDVFLNGELLAEGLPFREASDLLEWQVGDYDVTVTLHGEEASLSLLHYDDPMAGLSLLEQVNASLEGTAAAPIVEVVEPTLALEEGEDVTLILTPLEDGSYGVIPVLQGLDTVEHSKTANNQLVHAVAGVSAVDFADITQADRAPRLIFEGIPFGAVSEIETTRDGQTHFGLYEAGLINATAALVGDEFKVADVEEITQLQDVEFEANTSTLYVVSTPLRPEITSQKPDVLHYSIDNRPSFGGPASVGQLLFTTYMLPFQVIAVLLLVAMIGAIVLTRDAVPPPRRRHPRRLASTGEALGEPSQD